jgi:hypothetical protein
VPNPISASPPSKKGRGRTPIIIVPASVQSIITLSNVKNLLEDHKYMSHEVKIVMKNFKRLKF